MVSCNNKNNPNQTCPLCTSSIPCQTLITCALSSVPEAHISSIPCAILPAIKCFVELRDSDFRRFLWIPSRG